MCQYVSLKKRELLIHTEWWSGKHYEVWFVRVNFEMVSVDDRGKLEIFHPISSQMVINYCSRKGHKKMR